MMHELHSTKIRRAFTLVEILVVIAIIAILAALGAWGVFAVVGNQQRRNTENTIMVVNKVLQDHWKYVIEEANKDPVISPAVIALAGSDPTGQRARVLWIKVRLMEAFPQSFDEIGQPLVPPFVYTNAFGTGVLIPSNTSGIQQRYIADYQKRIPVAPPWFSATQPSNKTSTNNGPPYAATPSSACLLIALSVNRGGSSLSQDAIKFAVKDTDADGIFEIVDGWNRPLKFTRFDSSATVQAANPVAAGGRNAKYADPADADGMLLTSNWYGSLTRPTFETKFLYTISGNNGTNANYVIPSIISAGKDGVMGPPSTDDVISYQLRGN